MPRDLYAELIGDDKPSTSSSNGPVSNLFPRITNVPYRLAIIGEAPGSDEVDQGLPFVGYSGQLLDKFLSRFGILRDACFIGNVCQHRPPSNKIAELSWDGPEISGGIAKLREDLTHYRPNVVLLLGGSALHAFKNPNIIPKKRKDKNGWKFVFPDGIGDWRGSFFMSHMDAPCSDVKCLSGYHPAACLRQYEWTPLLMMDIKRAFDDATFPEMRVPQRHLKLFTTVEELLSDIQKIKQDKPLVSVDIEGYINAVSCLSLSTSPDFSFIVPLARRNNEKFYATDNEEFLIWKALTSVLSDPSIPKVLQNGLYDRFVLQYSYGLILRGVSDDTMLKHWELYCELEKSLGVQCSLYTREPYYKQDRKSEDRRTFWEYCCRDSATTLEINNKLDKYLSPESRRHYEFNMVLLNALLYMELRGIKYDKKLAEKRLKETEQATYELQYDLDKASGFGLNTTDKVVLRATLRDVMCWKKDASRVKEEYKDSYDLNMRTLLGEGELTKSELGRLSIALGLSLNVKGKAFKDYLYKTLGLPEQYHPVTKAITTDYEALLQLKKKTHHPIIDKALPLSELLTRMVQLRMEVDQDGRIRSTYNEVGSETGRVTCKKSPTGTGRNLQATADEDVLKEEDDILREGLRDLITADDGCYLAKCDLKGADGWTVGANMASLGDYSMLDDLKFGIKPAQVLAFMLRHGPTPIAGKSREELKEILKEVKKDDWDYFACKQCIWGFCYLMGARKAASHVFKLSAGEVDMTEKQMEELKRLLFLRYNVPIWWRAMEARLYKQPYPPRLTSPSGHTRMFFNRKQEILGEALAHEPQSVTTYATNMAVFKCWTDPENRQGNKLRIEPLHQVHDEMLCQFKKEDTEWAVKKIKKWFSNEINIAGIKLVIPFEGSYGKDWAMNERSKVGTI